MGEKNPNSQTGANFTNGSKFHKPEQISQMGVFFCFFLFVYTNLKVTTFFRVADMLNRTHFQ